MGKKLIITEKPSVARDLARALGKFSNKKEYLENEQYVISWAVGHLVTLAEPEDYNKKWKMWRLALLPVIPDTFKLKAISDTKERLKVIKKWMASDEVEAVVNACDAGREGELIFRNIYQNTGCEKHVFRLWLSSMTVPAIREAFEKLKPGDEFDRLGAAARCRSEGDWLVGINGTRVFTARFKVLLSVGRVQTPTLAILVEREREVQNFTPVPYWEVFAEFRAEEETYIGKWTAKEDRVYKEEEASSLVAKVEGKEGKVDEFSDRKSREAHPLLYDLTELQRDANRRYGFSARRTLHAAQRLYEGHKVITYPRTDSRYLSKDLGSQVEKCWKMLGQCGFSEITRTSFNRRSALADRRVFNSSKIRDHHAIIPTGEKINWDSLKADEYKVMDLIAKRFLSAFLPDAVWAHRRIKTVVENEVFLSRSKVLEEAGWRAAYGEKPLTAGKEFLPVVRESEKVITERSWSEHKETKPPPRYTEATLLSAMEAAGRFVEEEELREALKSSGIGTPATRASIIERLIEVGYVEREGKTLFPAPKGMELIGLVERIPVPELASPQLTGEWEKKLSQIESGHCERKQFMENIKRLTVEMVEKVKEKEDTGEREKMNQPVGKCPLCGAPVLENRSAFGCSRWKEGCSFTLWKRVLSRQITRVQARKLVETGRTDKISGFRSKKGRRFSARLVLQDEGKIGFEFDAPVRSQEANQKGKKPKKTGRSDKKKNLQVEGRETQGKEKEKRES